jgi:simple sugar transport system substrate-binding protein/basic membrane protein A
MLADADAPRVLREYAEQGYEMIVAHSFSFGDAEIQVATEYPDINFAWGGGIKKTAKNVADYDQPFYQAAYPLGIIAAKMSKTGKLGALYGFDIPVCHAMGEALLAGAKTVNPDAQLIMTAVGDWVDVAKAKEAALAQADAGVDFWIECGEGPALGAVEAAKERGGYVTGYVGDMTENGPDVVLGTSWGPGTHVHQDVEQTATAPLTIWYNYGVPRSTEAHVHEALKGKIPADALAAADKAFEDIKSGKFEVPFVAEAAK